MLKSIGANQYSVLMVSNEGSLFPIGEVGYSYLDNEWIYLAKMQSSLKGYKCDNLAHGVENILKCYDLIGESEFVAEI